MRYIIWGMVILLIVGHQDFWFWSDTTLIAGFIPVGLFYHAGISLAAAFTWYLATIFAWPDHLEEATIAATNDSHSQGSTP